MIDGFSWSAKIMASPFKTSVLKNTQILNACPSEKQTNKQINKQNKNKKQTNKTRKSKNQKQITDVFPILEFRKENAFIILFLNQDRES